MQASKWNQDIIVEPLDRTQLRLSWVTRLKRRLRTEFTKGPGRSDTCHLSFSDETVPDCRYYPATLKDIVRRLCDFSLRS